mmetsp:Transcript_34928/g.31459  ORF Transcript_34928/g.31459 Transcript_34928/m.31459 type:complete len:167 (-) Transcript_34928:33-533(-)
MVKKLTFGDSSSNLRFQYCFFSRDEHHIFTIQNPLRDGNSYLTSWDLNNNLEPVKTIKLHNHAITATCMNTEGTFMGLGTVDGGSKVVNTRYVEVDCQDFAHDLIVKSVSFINDSRHLASVSADYTFYFLPNVRPEGWFSKITKMWVAAMIVIWFAMFINNQLGLF